MKTELKQQSVRLFGVVILVTALPVCASLFASPQGKIVRNAEPSGSELITGYRQWQRVNPTPVVMAANVAAACAAPASAPAGTDPGNPHLNKFITVYVNDIGRSAMMEDLHPHFPVGSIIVKEKLPARDSTTPELLTVMIKREAGYDAAGGNWEYMALDGTGKAVQARGHLEKCQACHLMVKDADYVSRIYLPQETREKLK